MKPATFLGLRTAIYYVPDMEKAKAWYRSVLGIDPYFDEPFYVGFNVGGFELGLHPAGAGDAPGSAGVAAYWGVGQLAPVWARLLELGATPLEKPQDVGGGIQVAAVQDPFGNRLGIIENPHFPNQA
ncbi:MAG TPA: VOC family protein [Candidatus Eisenbacteria bacterium]|nr:VOC family protein [Candidatus Eisenbacteria bacterium]